MADASDQGGMKPVHGVVIILVSAAAVLGGMMALGFRPKSTKG